MTSKKINGISQPAEDVGIQSSVLLSYNTDGRVSRFFLPNYFNPPPGSQAENWLSTQQYDVNGIVLSSVDPNSGLTQYMHNLEGLLRFVQNAQNALDGIVLYKIYDDQYRLRESGYIRMNWDAALLKQKAEIADFPQSSDGAIARTRYTYGGDGTQVTDLGRLTRVEIMDENGVSESINNYSYDAKGRLQQREVVLVSDQVSQVIAYTYDNLGNVNGTTYPSGFRMMTERDEMGRVMSYQNSSSEELLHLLYTDNSLLSNQNNTLLTAAGIGTDFSYSPQGWLLSSSSSNMQESLSYTQGGYNGEGYFNGNVASKTVQLKVPDGSQLPSEVTYKFSYDTSNRLKVAACYLQGQLVPEWSLGLINPMSYDDNGNLVQVDNDHYTFDSGTDFVANTDGSANQDFGKDASGATIQAKPRGIANILRDISTGRSRRIETTQNGTVDLVYDKGGKRLSKKTENYTRFYSRDAMGRLLNEETNTGGTTTTKEFYYGPRGLVGMKTPTGMLAIETDMLRTPRIVSNSSGTVAAAFHYQPYGTLIDPGNDVNRELLSYLFGGYELDQETGLYNAGARLYDPLLKRFYSIDPKRQFASPYTFAGNNPVNMIDPDGEASWFAQLIGAIVGLVVTAATAFVTGGIATAAGVSAGGALGSAVVGAISGTAGSIAAGGTAAGISHESYDGARVGLDALTGAITCGAGGGAVGFATSRAMSTGKTILLGGVVGGLSSAAANGIGVASGLTKFDPVGIGINTVSGAFSGFIAVKGVSFFKWATGGSLTLVHPAPQQPLEFNAALNTNANPRVTFNETMNAGEFSVENPNFSIRSSDNYSGYIDLDSELLHYRPYEPIFDQPTALNVFVNDLTHLSASVPGGSGNMMERPVPFDDFIQYLRESQNTAVANFRGRLKMKGILLNYRGNEEGAFNLSQSLANAFQVRVIVNRLDFGWLGVSSPAVNDQ